jgi:hypothetical protein
VRKGFPRVDVGSRKCDCVCVREREREREQRRELGQFLVEEKRAKEVDKTQAR